MRAVSKVTVCSLSTAVVLCTVMSSAANGAAPFHERKEVAGLAIVFGAEPEPALTEEVQFLRWRISNVADSEPYTELNDAELVITRDGREYGPFPVRGQRRDPGLYQTRHIFTSAGEYGTVLRFRKGDAEQVYSVDFDFNINDRAELEIPRSRGGGGQDGGDVAAVVAALDAYATAITSMDINAVAEVVTDDFLIFEGAGVNRGWADYRDNHLGPELTSFKAIAITFSDVEAEAAGSLAWASLRYSTHIETEERTSDGGGVGTAVLVRGGDGRWRLRHLHTTPARRRQ